MKDLSEESNVEPFRRMETFSNFVNGFNTNPTIYQELEKLGISYKPALKVDGIVLPAQTINVRWVFIVEQNEFERVQIEALTQCIFSRTFDKGRSVITNLGLTPWGLSQDIYKGVPKSKLNQRSPIKIGMISFWFPRVAFKGSNNPTHYHVLLDEHQMAADLFQFFIFQMGHLYFNLKKSVRAQASC
ncbi:hypothetical protein ACTFIY_004516 [Dictyostelium cf. discoideum]